VFPNLIESDGIYGNAMLQKWLRVQRNLHFLSLVLQASSMHSIIDTWLMILIMIFRCEKLVDAAPYMLGKT